MQAVRSHSPSSSVCAVGATVTLYPESSDQTRAIIFDCEFNGMLAKKLFSSSVEINTQRSHKKGDANLFDIFPVLV